MSIAGCDRYNSGMAGNNGTCYETLIASCRHRDHKKDYYLSINRPISPAQGNERQVDGIQHQFDRHKHHDDVAADQNPYHSDGEQDCAEHQEIADGRHFLTALRCCAAALLAAFNSAWDRAWDRLSALKPSRAFSHKHSAEAILLRQL